MVRQFKEVFKTILLVYRVSEAVAYKMETYFYPTRRTFNTLRNVAITSRLISKETFISGDETWYLITDLIKSQTQKLDTDRLEYGYQKKLYTNQTIRKILCW